jgi:hypothetical protein
VADPESPSGLEGTCLVTRLVLKEVPVLGDNHGHVDLQNKNSEFHGIALTNA